MNDEIMTQLGELIDRIVGRHMLVVNEKIDKLSVRVDKLHDRVDKLSVRVDKLHNRIDKLSVKVDRLTVTVNGMRDQLAKTMEDVTWIKEKLDKKADKPYVDGILAVHEKWHRQAANKLNLQLKY